MKLTRNQLLELIKEAIGASLESTISSGPLTEEEKLMARELNLKPETRMDMGNFDIAFKDFTEQGQREIIMNMFSDLDSGKQGELMDKVREEIKTRNKSRHSESMIKETIRRELKRILNSKR